MPPKRTTNRPEKFEDIVAEALNPKNIQLYDFADNKDVSTSSKDSDIVHLSYKNIFLNITNAYETRHSLLLYGNPGLGKSSIVLQTGQDIAKSQNRQFVNWQASTITVEEPNENGTTATREITKKEIMEHPEKYFCFIDIRTAQLEPSDLSGIPNIRSREQYLEMNPQKWVYFMSLKNSAGILFLDEINQGSPQVLKALFQVVLDRGVGNLSFSDGWGIIAAGNIGSMFGNELLPPALTNRFLAGELIADPESWIEYAEKSGVDDTIINFIRSRPEENFYRPPAEGTSNPFPSPRQFVGLSKQIEHIKLQYYNAQQNDTPMVQSIYKTVSDVAAQLCGVNWAQRYISFLRYQKEFDWATIVKNPKKATNFEDKDVDKIYAIALVVSDAVLRAFDEKSTLTDEGKYNFAADFCNVLIHFSKEFQMIILNRVNRKSKSCTAKLISIVFNNIDKEPFKTVIPMISHIAKLANGESA